MGDAGHAAAPGRASRAAAACLLAAAAAAGVTGCVASAGAADAIRVATAYVAAPTTPGTTVAYVVIRNNGPADRLTSARTSAGGRVTFRVAVGPHAATMRTVRSVSVPGHSFLAMRPDGVHMIITGAGPLRGGKAVTLTLVFAHAGAVSVVAQVTNPESGGGSYFLN
jgi:copper(I)-binding protein